MILRQISVWAVCGLCGLSSVAVGAQNLISNGELESTTTAVAQELPGGWEPLRVGAPSKFVIDTSDKHAGRSSVRIESAEITRAYIRSTTPIEVAPTETIEAAAWVKVRDVPADKGTVIMIAEFTDAAGRHLGVEKFNVLNVKTAGDGWQQLKGSVTVPADAARLHLRLGFSYSKGTVWWDDVTVTAKRPLVCRIDVPDQRLSPAMRKLPVTVLNRDKSKKPIVISVALNKQVKTTKAALTGEAVQRIDVPIGTIKPGNVVIEASLLEREDAKPLWTDKNEATVPPPLTLGVPSPTHWAIDDGPPVIEGIVDLAVGDDARLNATLSVRVVDSSGNMRGQWLPGGGAPADGRRAFSFKSGINAEGDYKIIATFTPKRGEAIKVEQPWYVIRRQQAMVPLNTRGYPEYDGKAIFPLGMFNGGKFKEQAAAGFTVTHAYNAVRIEGPDLIAADQRAVAFLNSTQQHGMKALFMVPMRRVIAGDWDGVRRRIRMFRNHPALLAWDEEEGFARGDFKPDTLATLRQILTEEDPHHPFMVGDARDSITRIPPDRSNFFPVGEMDLGMWWWYPFPLKERGGDALLGEDAGAPGLDLTPPSFLVNAKTRKPLWVGLQSYKKPGEGSRYPTPDEYRAQAYLAIVHGAKGLMWYGGSVTGGLYNAPDEGHWSELKKIVRELRNQSDLFMSPTDPTVVTIAPPDAPVSAIVKRTTKGKIVIAVNRSGQPLEVTIAGKLMTLDGFGVFVEKL
ncbi:MAG: hypothetical protein QOF78_2793 [Phycisphaerales bacterium]|jgi:hypothetical protein|nr:hypothetical protein [Phycisphaerales bacterium]